MRKKTNTEFVAFRLSKWEREQLEKACKITGQSKSRFLANAMLEKCQKAIK